MKTIIKKYVQYLKDNPEGYWFKRKLYGWGWTPATRQGWLFILGYIILVEASVFGVLLYPGASHVVFWHVGIILILTAVLLFIVYKKGEKPPRWQWGEGK